MSTCFNSPSFWSYPKVITALSFLSLILVIFVPVLFRLLLLSSANSFYRYYFALLSNILAWSWTMAALIAHGCQLRGLDNEDFLLTLNLFCIGLFYVASLVTAMATDKYFPDCKMTEREVVHYSRHAAQTNPAMSIVLKSRSAKTDENDVNSSKGRWQRISEEVNPSGWIDTSDSIDEGVVKRQHPQMMLMTLKVTPHDDGAKRFIERKIFDTGNAHSMIILPEDVKDYYLRSVVSAPDAASSSSNRGILNGRSNSDYSTCAIGARRRPPPLASDRPLRILIHPTSVWVELILKFGWILNLCAFSGIVFSLMLSLKDATKNVEIRKEFTTREEEEQDNHHHQASSSSSLGAEPPLSPAPPPYQPVINEALPSYQEATADN